MTQCCYPPFIDGGPIEAHLDQAVAPRAPGYPPFIDGGPIEASTLSPVARARVMAIRRSSTAAPLKLLPLARFTRAFRSYPPFIDGGPIEAGRVPRAHRERPHSYPPFIDGGPIEAP